MTTGELMRERIERVATTYRGRGLAVLPSQVDRAVALALGWAEVAELHGAQLADLDTCADIAGQAIDRHQAQRPPPGRPVVHSAVHSTSHDQPAARMGKLTTGRRLHIADAQSGEAHTDRATVVSMAKETTELQVLAHDYVTGRVRARAIRPLTAVNERRVLGYFTTAMGRRSPGQVGRADLERWMGTMVHLAPGTVRARFAIVRRFLSHLVDTDVIKRSPARAIPAPKVPRSRHRALSHEQAAAIVAACAGPRDRCIVLLDFQLGLRRAEIAGLQVGDFTFGQRPKVRVHGKGGHERILAVTAEALVAVNSYLATSPANGGPLIRGDKYPARGVSPDWVGRTFARIAYEAGVKAAPRDGISTHAGRHTCATDIHELTGDVLAVQQVLGHQSLAATQVYVDALGVEKLRTAMEGRSYRDRNAA